MVGFERGRALRTSAGDPRIPAGATPGEVLAARGAPDEITLRYSSRTADTHYRERYVTIVDRRVVRVTAGVYVD